MNKKVDLKKISVTAMLSALAYLCMFIFKFKVGFLTFDLKDAIFAIVAFMYGPIYGVVSAVLVAFVEFISVSDTGVYGLIMNALSSSTFAFVCGISYKYRHTLLGAVLGSISAVFATTSVMLIANIFITPYYMTGTARSEVIAMIPTLLLPFNLIKGTVNAALTMIIYKPITSALKRTGLIKVSNANKTDVKKFVIISVISLVVLILAILAIILILNGKISIFGKN